VNIMPGRHRLAQDRVYFRLLMATSMSYKNDALRFWKFRGKDSMTATAGNYPATKILASGPPSTLIVSAQRTARSFGIMKPDSKSTAQR